MKSPCKSCTNGRLKNGHYCAACWGLGEAEVKQPPKLTVVGDKK